MAVLRVDSFVLRVDDVSAAWPEKSIGNQRGGGRYRQYRGEAPETFDVSIVLKSGNTLAIPCRNQQEQTDVLNALQQGMKETSE